MTGVTNATSVASVTIVTSQDARQRQKVDTEKRMMRTNMTLMKNTLATRVFFFSVGMMARSPLLLFFPLDGDEGEDEDDDFDDDVNVNVKIV